MKNNNGFTLIEMIGVVTLMVLLSLIAIPIVNTSVNNSKNKAYNILVEKITDAAKEYFFENYYSYENDLETNGYVNITVDELRISNTLEKDLINPKTNEVIDGYVTIKIQGTEEYIYEFNLE